MGHGSKKMPSMLTFPLNFAVLHYDFAILDSGSRIVVFALGQHTAHALQQASNKH